VLVLPWNERLRDQDVDYIGGQIQDVALGALRSAT
jgi:hypothetical protein